MRDWDPSLGRLGTGGRTVVNRVEGKVPDETVPSTTIGRPLAYGTMRWNEIVFTSVPERLNVSTSN
jgi:hypothetical protein